MMFLDKIALALSIVGGLNWGLIGLLNFDLVAFISGGSGTWLARIIYTIVGLTKYPIPASAIFFLPCSGRKGAPAIGKGRTGWILAATRRGWWALLKICWKRTDKDGQGQGCRNSPVAAGLDQAAAQGFSEPPWQAAD